MNSTVLQLMGDVLLLLISRLFKISSLCSKYDFCNELNSPQLKDFIIRKSNVDVKPRGDRDYFFMETIIGHWDGL